MSVSTYEIGCGYKHSKLKNKVYFLSKSFFTPSNNSVTVSIDSGDASVSITSSSPYPTAPNVIEGFSIKFTETESLDERYRFTKQLNISILGHLTDTTWLLEGDYYLMVETIEGTFYLINVDFPSKMSFTYNLSNSQDQTDFVFTSNSNFPTLKVNSVPWESFNTCKTYNVPGVDYLKLLEKDYVTIDTEDGVINLFDSHVFKDIDYLKNTISLQEVYDGDVATTTISFEIPFDDYKTSWQYNLLEFKQNLYVAQIGSINNKTIFAGTEHGLEPSYEINASTSNGEATSIKITLTEASNWGIFEYDTWTYYVVPERQFIGVQTEYICLAFGIAGYTLMMEVDENNTPTGRYKCLASEYDRYERDYNIIGTYEECERFESPKCARYIARSRGETGLYTCINGDKYELIGDVISYDGGKTWIYDNLELGEMVESASTYCEITPEYKWELTDDYVCVEYIPPKYVLELRNGNTISADCDNTSAITTADTSSYKNAIVSAVIGQCVSSISDSGFSFCTRLSSVTIPDSVTEIDNFAFQSCRSLTNVTIPNSVITIGNAAFINCSGITSIDIPDSVTTLGKYAFTYCYGLTNANIGNGLTTIDEYTFVGCTGLTSCTIGSGVTTIGNSAFHGCSSLPSIIIPDNVITIGSTAFQNCHSLANITFGTGLTTIGQAAFFPADGVSCPVFTTLVIPDNVTTISHSAFKRCTGLTSVTIGSGITSIGEQAFNSCTALNSVTINRTTPPSLSIYVFDNTNDCPIYVPPGCVEAYREAWGGLYYNRIRAIR